MKRNRAATHISAGITLQRLKRELPSLAEANSLDLVYIEDLAHGQQGLCAICMETMLHAVLFKTHVATVLICPLCDRVYKNTKGDIIKLGDSGRFDRRYLKKRARLARIISLCSTGE